MKISSKQKKSLMGTIKTDTNLKEFFTKPHTITSLIIMLLVLIYLAFYKKKDTVITGFIITYLVFLVISLLQFTDSVFERPHPAVWRIVKGTSIYYLLILVFVLFQDKDSVRQWLRYLDPNLGVSLPEKNYGTNCSLTLNNLYNQMDLFVPAHIIGWYFKALILRDYYLCWVLSIMFEVIEYSFQHHLPNFAECWWDHWILDVLTCNALGIHLGIMTCQYFNAKMYKWRGKINIQFEIFRWMSSARTFRQYIGIIVLVFVILAAELNTFYLKYLLWIPPDHYLNLIRLIIHVLMGCVSVREGYAYFSDRMCKSFGYQLWICIACICVECLICVKFGKNEFTENMPMGVKVFWVVLITFLVTFPCFRYGFKKDKRD